VLPNSKQAWSVTTLVMVTTPTLGATLKRGIHRVIGTFIGVAVGEVTIIIATYADPLAIILAVTVIFAPITIYFKYSALYQKSYSMYVHHLNPERAHTYPSQVRRCSRISCRRISRLSKPRFFQLGTCCVSCWQRLGWCSRRHYRSIAFSSALIQEAASEFPRHCKSNCKRHAGIDASR
jgi:hypothetical protein